MVPTQFVVLFVPLTYWPIIAVSRIFGLVRETPWYDNARIVEEIPLGRVSPPTIKWL